MLNLREPALFRSLMISPFRLLEFAVGQYLTAGFRKEHFNLTKFNGPREHMNTFVDSRFARGWKPPNSGCKDVWTDMLHR